MDGATRPKSLTLKSDQILRVGLRVFEDDEDSGIADAVDDWVIAELGARTLRRFLHGRTTDRELARQYAALEDVLDAARVSWRVVWLSWVVEVHRKVDTLSIESGCTQ